jgi:hypothetical protein
MIVRLTGTPERYRLFSYYRVTTRDGESYMRPLPSGEVSLAHQGLIFDRLEIIDPPGSGQYGGGDTFLTRDSGDAELRLTANA